MDLQIDLSALKKEFENELTNNILGFWTDEVYDRDRHIFCGRITNDGKKYWDAPLSAVFTTRILWTFSSAYRIIPRENYKAMADEAFRILKEMFLDKSNGGIFWSVSPTGQTLDSRKQFYAQAFFIYALSEYHLAFGIDEAKELAISTYELIEQYAFDPVYGGYTEAKSVNWHEIADQRLSEKEINVKKTMNTHLHILEAYTSLYRIWKPKELKTQLGHLIQIFQNRIISNDNFHFQLFFDEDWKIRSDIQSYGHDIEGSWLLWEAAEVLGDERLMEEVRVLALEMAEVAARDGLGKEGGMLGEKAEGHVAEQYDWWPQAEAVVGFYNAYTLGHDKKYLLLSNQSWNFIKRYIIDRKNGEWFWGVDEHLLPLGIEKVNGWKASYHNGRMCMEMIRRIGNNN